MARERQILAARSEIPPGCRITRNDLFRFREGSHARLYEKMGAHRTRVGDRPGVVFTVWAPAAASVSVVGDFNGWDHLAHPLQPIARSGIWSGFVPAVEQGAVYKYHLVSRLNDYRVDKADPFAVRAETPPQTASVVWDLGYTWNDDAWIAARAGRDPAAAPMSTYELHLGSWRRPAENTESLPDYRWLARELVPYLKEMNFTHVELMPPMEHPFYGSWGYQCTGFFAASSRYGKPQDLMYLIDQLHQAGIGVILDWVPSHFPTDEHGLGFFDGTHLFEHADPRQGFHPDWKSFIFNYDLRAVRSFLLSSAVFWLDHYHVDALRVDAVSSMLYRDYSREAGQWIPNSQGGRENLEAIAFLQRFNHTVHTQFPGVLTIAEESTAWPLVSSPTYIGGLGFDMKWDMGWMHDTLAYFGLDPIQRKFHHEKITFRMVYAHSENFVLSLSHDEVVHGKFSLIGKMLGDEWQRFAGLRAMLGYMHGMPGKKLLFMGAEIGQWREWNHDRQLDWHLLDEPMHSGLRRWVCDLNRLHVSEPAMHALDFSAKGFEWVDCSDMDQSVFTFLRHAREDQSGDSILVVCNFTTVPRPNYRVGVPRVGTWSELLNSDADNYGGSGQGNLGGSNAVPIRYHNRPFSLNLNLPPMSVSFFRSPRRAAYRLSRPDPRTPG